MADPLRDVWTAAQAAMSDPLRDAWSTTRQPSSSSAFGPEGLSRLPGARKPAKTPASINELLSSIEQQAPATGALKKSMQTEAGKRKAETAKAIANELLNPAQMLRSAVEAGKSTAEYANQGKLAKAFGESWPYLLGLGVEGKAMASEARALPKALRFGEDMTAGISAGAAEAADAVVPSLARKTTPRMDRRGFVPAPWWESAAEGGEAFGGIPVYQNPALDVPAMEASAESAASTARPRVRGLLTAGQPAFGPGSAAANVPFTERTLMQNVLAKAAERERAAGLAAEFPAGPQLGPGIAMPAGQTRPAGPFSSTMPLLPERSLAGNPVPENLRMPSPEARAAAAAEAEAARPRRRPLGEQALRATPEEVAAYLEGRPEPKVSDLDRMMEAALSERRTAKNNALSSAQRFRSLMKDATDERVAEGIRSGELHPDGSERISFSGSEGPVELFEKENGSILPGHPTMRELELQSLAMSERIAALRGDAELFLETYPLELSENAGTKSQPFWGLSKKGKREFLKNKREGHAYYDPSLSASENRRILGNVSEEEAGTILNDWGFDTVKDYLDQRNAALSALEEAKKLEMRQLKADFKYAQRHNDAIELGVIDQEPMDAESIAKRLQEMQVQENSKRYSLDAEQRKVARENNAELKNLRLRNRSGSVNPTLLSTVGGAAVGGAAGAATADQGDTGEAIFRGAVGAALGGVGGRSAMRAMERNAASAAGAAQAGQAAQTGATISALDAALAQAENTRRPPPVRVSSRSTPFTGEVIPEHYVGDMSRFSDNPRVQELVKNAVVKNVQENVVPLRAATDMEINGRLVKAGELLEPKSFQDVRDAVAASLGVNPMELAAKSKAGQRLNGEDMLHLRTAIAGTLDESKNLLEQINTPGAFKTEKELERAKRLLDRSERDYQALLTTFGVERTGMGRDMNSLKIAALHSNDPVTWLDRLTKVAQRPLTMGEAQAAAEAAKANDINTLIDLGKQVKLSTWQEKLITYMQASILSSPKTHLANAIGNMSMQALEVAKDIPATLADMGIAAITGQRTKAFSLVEIAKSSFRGAKQGVIEARDILAGRSVSSDIADIAKSVRYDTKLLNLYNQIVLRPLSAADRLFYNMSLSRSLNEQARVIAKAEKRVGEAFNTRVAELTKTPTPDMEIQAIYDSALATFQDNNKLSQAALDLRRKLGLPGKMLFLFAKTPANIAARVLDYSPIGFTELRHLAKALIKGESMDAVMQRRVVEAVGRASVGTGAAYLGAYAHKNGLVTGFFPDDTRERNAWANQGKTEGAVRLPESIRNITGQQDLWRQINKISPLGNLIQIGAAIQQIKDSKQEESNFAGIPYGKAVAMATAPLRSVVELPMVSNLNDLIDVAKKIGKEDIGEAVTDVASRQIFGFVPFSGALRSLTQSIDPNIRETRSAEGTTTIGNKLLAQVPFASKNLPQRVDALGRPLMREQGPIGAFFDFTNPRANMTSDDPVRQELERTGAVIAPIRTRQGESTADYAERQKAVGERLNAALGRIIASPSYQKRGSANTDKLRQALEATGVNASALSDEDIRAKMQGKFLEDRVEAMRRRMTVNKTTPSQRRQQNLTRIFSR
jgi:hypothetical protein